MNSVLINRCKNAIKSLEGCKGTSEQESLACFRIALSALEQQLIAWESTTSVYIKFITDERYQKLRPGYKKWYKPYRCNNCVNSESVPLQLTTTVDGREWKLFCVNFKSDYAVHSAYMYAIGREHASYRLEDLKQTGELQWGDLLSITG